MWKCCHFTQCVAPLAGRLAVRELSSSVRGCDLRNILKISKPKFHLGAKVVKNSFLMHKTALQISQGKTLFLYNCRNLSTCARVLAATQGEPRIKVKVRGIQKDVSPLTTKRIVRRKKTKDSEAHDKVIQMQKTGCYNN